MRAPQRFPLLFALAAMSATAPAMAQTRGGAATVPSAPAASASPAPPSYPSCEGRKPTQADTDAAHGAYMAGKGSFDEADYTTALNYFKDAYRRDCTKHELLIIIARAYELKGERQDAIRALETYLERVPNAQDAEVQRRRIANLKAQMAVTPAPAPGPATPPSAAPVNAEKGAPPAPGANGPGSATSEPTAPAHATRHSAAPWIVVGAGGVAVIAGTVLLVIGTGKVSDAEKDCPSHKDCAPDVEKSGNTGRTLEGVGIVTGSVGVAAVIAGLLWHFNEHGEPKTGQVRSPRFTPIVRPGYAGVQLGASF